MKVIAYYCLHYGVDYLAYSIKSIYDVVDEILILYSPKPTHARGNTTKFACPDTRSQLVAEAALHDVDHKITWIDGEWWNESEHRSDAFKIARKKNYDILVMVDFDEIWDTIILQQLIKDCYDNPIYELRIKMRHFWRSFIWTCEDAMTQGRIFNLREPIGAVRYAEKFSKDYVWHFGYARSVKDIEYKISIHGHIGEWKEDWFEKTFKQWKEGMNDIHPTCVDIWTPKEFDKYSLPIFMWQHHYFNLKLIK